ncbi:hypothetical protein C0Q70_15957 [Pomacea canaliculata]|uniref:G-protein coupled receptors family 1 profile domain-containing protein n=1 Tax=Pomacea canaliculata TaxID=400727 RepID=A0A2T7NNF3_POMCA|nr:hypothetical protein C0Q70_15957 [Pomacea canaliculata]
MAGICFPVESKYHTAVLAVSRAQSICFLSAEKERKMNALQENDSVNATTDNYTTADHDNSSVLLFMKEDFEIAIAVPVSFLGIVCNLVSLTVWNTHTKYSASIFLFKYLAVWDTTFLVSYICKTLLNSFNFYYELTVVLEFFIGISKLLSVHTTLQIAVCRWLAVSRPLQVHNGSLLARRQIICVCVAVFIWCLCIANLHRVLDYLSQSELHLIVYKVIIIAIVGFIVPILLLVVFNVLLLRKTRSPSKLTASSAQQRRLQGSNPRVTLVVVLMSLFSVLSYPAAMTALIIHLCVILDKGYGTSKDLLILIAVVQIASLAELLNSSINIIFYYILSSNFRKALSKCCKCSSGDQPSDQPTQEEAD